MQAHSRTDRELLIGVKGGFWHRTLQPVTCLRCPRKLPASENLPSQCPIGALHGTPSSGRSEQTPPYFFFSDSRRSGERPCGEVLSIHTRPLSSCSRSSSPLSTSSFTCYRSSRSHGLFSLLFPTSATLSLAPRTERNLRTAQRGLLIGHQLNAVCRQIRIMEDQRPGYASSFLLE
jgi:hypothetical protein